MTEREIQRRIEAILSQKGFLDNIEDQEQISRVLASLDSETFLPSFPIDYLIRQRSAMAARHVLDALRSVEVISTASSSISLDRRDRLFPDLVLSNEKTGQIILIEIKRSEQTERETLTELLGYEHEIRNHLPFLSNFDLCFIVISNNYSALLEHSIASLMTWESKRILCLRTTLVDDQIKFKVHLPGAWTPIGDAGLPPGALPILTLRLKTKGEVSKNQSFNLVTAAADYIIHDGNRANSHGFLLIWEDIEQTRKEIFNECITLGVLNPYMFFPAAVKAGLLMPEQSPLCEFLTKEGRFEILGSAYTGIQTICRNAVNLLERYYTVNWAEASTWDLERNSVLRPPKAGPSLNHRAFPAQVEFWGVLGEYAREFILHPFVRTDFLPFIERRGLTWSHPFVGIPLLDELTNNRLFQKGDITCHDLFRFGCVLGSLRKLCEDSVNPPATLPASLTWAFIDVLSPLRELNQYYLAAESIKSPPPKLLVRGAEDAHEAIPELDSIIQWVTNEILGEQIEIYRLFFELGLRCFPLCDAYFYKQLSDADKVQIEAEAIQFSISALSNLAEDAARATSPKGEELLSLMIRDYFMAQEVNKPTEFRVRLVEIPRERHISLFGTALPRLMDKWIPPVFHKLNPVHVQDVDWIWLRSQIESFRQRGVKHPAVVVLPDGTVGTGDLDNYPCPVPEVRDPANEVLLAQRHPGGIDQIQVVAWKSLEAMRFLGSS